MKDNEKLRKVQPKEVYPVYCQECGWFGMSDDCLHGKCRNCGNEVKKDE